MSVRKIALFGVLCALALTSMASAAFATTSLHIGSTTGSLVPNNDWIMGNQVGTSVLTSSSGNISCTTGYVDMQITGNSVGGATVTGTVSNTLMSGATGLVFGSPSAAKCTDSIAFANVTYCEMDPAAPYSNTATTNVDGSGNPVGGTLKVNGLKVVCHTNLGQNCTFTANAGSIGTYTNSNGNLVFSNVAATGGGAFGCPASGTFNATYGPGTYTGSITGGTPGSGQVYFAL